jgi:hypothetical protein
MYAVFGLSLLIQDLESINIDRHNGEVTGTSESKVAALDQLRSWRAWFDRRDPLIYAAHLAGASLSEIRDASGVAVNTARSAIAAQEAAVQTTATDPLATYHHPHFLSFRRPTATAVEFAFKPFTGNEPKPEMPHGPYRSSYIADDGVELTAGLSPDDMTALYQEYDAAQKLWATARFRQKLQAKVPKVSPVRSAYQAARTAMSDAYEALLTTSDSSWRSQIMRLAGLQDEARAAAAAWDAAEEELLTLEQTFLAESEYRYDDWQRPEIRNVLSEYGVDATAWELNSLDDHKPRGYGDGDFLAPAAKHTAEAIEQQNHRIREVANLVGEPGA